MEIPHRALRAAVLLLAARPLVVAGQTPLDIAALQFSPATTIAELDMGKLKGEPSRLAWSADGRLLYLQTTENRGRPDAKNHHYSFSVDGGRKQDLDAEPVWAADYWRGKSGQAPPDMPALKIDLKTETRERHTTSAPMGGDLARGGITPGEAGTSAGDAGSAAYGAQSATVHSMVLKGQTIGEFVNSVIVPGLTFGWGPKGSQVMAFAAPKDGRIVVMDYEGRKRDVDGTGDALLPAWSQDAQRLAWLEKGGRRKVRLRVANVTTS